MVSDKVLITEQILRDVAGAIYEKNSVAVDLRPIDFAEAILDITGGGDDVPDIYIDQGYVDITYDETDTSLTFANVSNS